MPIRKILTEIALVPSLILEECSNSEHWVLLKMQHFLWLSLLLLWPPNAIKLLNYSIVGKVWNKSLPNIRRTPKKSGSKVMGTAKNGKNRLQGEDFMLTRSLLTSMVSWIQNKKSLLNLV